jgi:hypothetical protein
MTFNNYNWDSYFTSILSSLSANPVYSSLLNSNTAGNSYLTRLSQALSEDAASASATNSLNRPSPTEESNSVPRKAETNNNDKSSGISKTAIIGIIVAVLLVVLIALVGWCIWRRKHPKEPKEKPETVMQTPGPQIPISEGPAPNADTLPAKDGTFYSPNPQPPSVSPHSPPPTHSPPPPAYPAFQSELPGGSTTLSTTSNVPSRQPTPTPPIHGVYETEARPWSVPPPAPSVGTTISGATAVNSVNSNGGSQHTGGHGVNSPGHAMYGQVHEAGGVERHQSPPPRQPERERPMQAPYDSAPQGPIFEMGDHR